MDIHHPGLINDCLISIFTFLKEDDLIVASCVCKVSGVTACGSTSCGFERIVIVNVIGFVSRTGMKLQRLRGCGGGMSLMHVWVRTSILNSCLRRRLCLQRWSFCNFAVMGPDGVNHSWKRYFLRRSFLEMKMSKGRSGSYTCKSLRGHTGELLREFTNTV